MSNKYLSLNDNENSFYELFDEDTQTQNGSGYINEFFIKFFGNFNSDISSDSEGGAHKLLQIKGKNKFIDTKLSKNPEKDYKIYFIDKEILSGVIGDFSNKNIKDIDSLKKFVGENIGKVKFNNKKISESYHVSHGSENLLKNIYGKSVNIGKEVPTVNKFTDDDTLSDIANPIIEKLNKPKKYIALKVINDKIYNIYEYGNARSVVVQEIRPEIKPEIKQYTHIKPQSHIKPQPPIKPQLQRQHSTQHIKPLPPPQKKPAHIFDTVNNNQEFKDDLTPATTSNTTPILTTPTRSRGGPAKVIGISHKKSSEEHKHLPQHSKIHLKQLPPPQKKPAHIFDTIHHNKEFKDDLTQVSTSSTSLRKLPSTPMKKPTILTTPTKNRGGPAKVIGMSHNKSSEEHKPIHKPENKHSPQSSDLLKEIQKGKKLNSEVRQLKPKPSQNLMPHITTKVTSPFQSKQEFNEYMNTHEQKPQVDELFAMIDKNINGNIGVILRKISLENIEIPLVFNHIYWYENDDNHQLAALFYDKVSDNQKKIINNFHPRQDEWEGGAKIIKSYIRYKPKI